MTVEQATRPIRLRLSRAKGFDLQAVSYAANGLPAAVVTRATIWGNPFAVYPGLKCRSTSGRRFDCVQAATVEEAVKRFRKGILSGKSRKARLHELAGKNLACYCRLDQLCHVDVLLELANRKPKSDPHPAFMRPTDPPPAAFDAWRL